VHLILNKQIHSYLLKLNRKNTNFYINEMTVCQF
jgi:hypothetical protein